MLSWFFPKLFNLLTLYLIRTRNEFNNSSSLRRKSKSFLKIEMKIN